MKTGFVLLLFALCALKVQALELTFTEDAELGEDVSYKVLIMNGVIEDGDALKVKEMLKSQKGKRTVFLITSPGGVKEEVRDLAKVILSHSQASFKRLHKPDLFAINQSCGSACTILSAEITNHRNPKALEFFVQSESEFFFHSPSKVFEDGKWLDLSEPSLRNQIFNEMLESYIKSGASSEWLHAHALKMKRSEGYTLSAANLCQSKARVIPEESCSRLSSDRFTELINEVFDQDRIFSQNKELQESLVRKTKKTRGLTRVFKKAFGI